MSRKFRFMACLAMGSAAFGQTGGFTVIDAPGAGPMGTFARSINQSGTVAGLYIDANQVNHAFVRSAAGEFTTFEAPAASNATFRRCDRHIRCAGRGHRHQPGHHGHGDQWFRRGYGLFRGQ